MTFRDGSIATIKGKRSINILRLPIFYNVLFVNGLNFFFDSRKPHPWKAYFVGPGERVKPRLFQALTRGTRPDSNSRPTVQISSPLPSRHAPCVNGLKANLLSTSQICNQNHSVQFYKDECNIYYRAIR
jgi:hypothetical protein